MALTTAQIQNAYVAFFNRPADVAGLTYWSSYAGSTADLLNTFAQSAEYKSLYSGLNNTQTVNAVYQNLFGHAPDVAGLTYWVTQLDQGKLAIGNIADAINKGAQGTDATIISNKVTAATAFTVALDTTAEIVAYAGVNSTGLAAVKAWLAAVTSDATTLANATSTTALNTITTTVLNNVASNGSTLTLTTGIDNLTGGDANDTFNGTLVNNEAAAAGTGTTFQVSDIINGGAGTDTLSLLVAGANSTSGGGAAPLAQTLGAVTNVEVLSVKNLSTGSNAGVTLNSTAAPALTTIENNGSTAAVAVTGVQNNAAVNVKNSNAATSVTFADGKITSGVTINVDGAGTAASNETITLATASAAGTATSATINASGSNVVVLAPGGSDATSIGAANGIKTLTITGTGSLNVSGKLTNTGSLAGDLTTLDASANSGGVTTTVSNTVATGVTVKGGSGADVITVGGALAAGANITLGAGNDKLLNNSGSVAASTASKTTVVDAGDGVDILAASLVNAGNGAVFKNFETLSLGGASVDASLLTGSTLTSLSVDALLGGDYTYSNITPAMSLTNNFAGDNNGRATTLSFTTASVAGTSDAFSITFNGTAQTAAQTAANVKLGTVAAAGIENFTIVSGGTNNWNSMTLGADTSARTVTINGATNLDLAFSGAFGEVNAGNGTVGVSSIDGSAATGKLAINLGNVVNATAGLTVKGGSAADTITTSTSKATLTGGAGADSFVVTASVYGAGKIATVITDAASGDKITLIDQGTETFTTAKVDVSAAQTLVGALGIATNGVDGSTNGAIKWFQYAGNTYIVEAIANAAGHGGADAAATDIVVQLTGLIDLSTASGAGTNVLTLA